MQNPHDMMMNSQPTPPAPMMPGVGTPAADAITFDLAMELMESEPAQGVEMLKLLLDGMGQPLSPEQQQIATQIIQQAGGA